MTSMSMEDRLDKGFAQGWRPEVGDKITGTITEISEMESQFGGTYPIVVVATDNGDEVAVHAFHTVLKANIARQRPQVGDRIGIKYFGRDEHKGYENYRVVVERAQPGQAAEPNWDAMQKQAEGELERPDGDHGNW